MSIELSKDLQRLDDFLLSDAAGEDNMLLAELDGFMAGLHVCPEMILPSEWLPQVWREEAPAFESAQQANDVLGLIMAHYNSVAEQLQRGQYDPIYDISVDDTVFWETWLGGFQQAMRLRPEAWQSLARSEADNDDVQAALFLVGRLFGLISDSIDQEPMEIDEELEEAAPDLIPEYVMVLHQASRARADPFAVAANENRRKVGRNDPCPCGSGKKYKKCCLV